MRKELFLYSATLNYYLGNMWLFYVQLQLVERRWVFNLTSSPVVASRPRFINKLESCDNCNFHLSRCKVSQEFFRSTKPVAEKGVWLFCVCYDNTPPLHSEGVNRKWDGQERSLIKFFMVLFLNWNFRLIMLQLKLNSMR